MTTNIISYTVDTCGLWQNTLPYIVYPKSGESFYGYLLRLDIANNFPSGTVLSYINKHNTGIKSINRPGLFLCGTIFDINKLSVLTSIPIGKLSELTTQTLLKNVFQIVSPYPELLGYSSEFKVCPQCIKSYSLPLVHVFKNIYICIEHNIRLLTACKCGNKLVFFTNDKMYFTCPYCNINYEKLETRTADSTGIELTKQYYLYNAYNSLILDDAGFIKHGEPIYIGFEKRLRSVTTNKNIKHQQFKNIFGYEAAKLKNGHGLSNISLSKILDMLYELGYSPSAFKNMKLNNSVNKIDNINPNDNLDNLEHICPNVYCKYYRVRGQGNIKFYGRRKNKTGDHVIEEYCNSCGTRFIGNNIIQSYDYNPGLRQIDIEKARMRVGVWQSSLKETCEYMIANRIPITLTGCYKKAGIPIGKTYFCDRLGLIDLLEEYADIQRKDMNNCSSELDPKEVESFVRRIYKRKRC